MKSGARKTERKKSTPMVTAVRPVRPPSRMPVADSMWMITGEQPAMAATTVPTDELKKAHRLRRGKGDGKRVSPGLEEVDRSGGTEENWQGERESWVSDRQEAAVGR